MLEVLNLKKAFKTKVAINDLSFSVKEHIAYGFIGPNGAGKTTTMKLIMGFLKSDEGKVLFNQEELTFNHLAKDIGYLPDVPVFYNYLTPRQYLTLCGKLTNINDLKSRVNEVLKTVGLEEENRPIKGFSRGMKQRLGIAQAILNKPKLLICDEITSALDPIGRREILDLLKEIKKETTIIFSTHIISDVEEVCDEVGIINQGKMVLTGKINELKEKYHQENIHLTLNDDLDITKDLKKIKGVLDVTKTNHYIISVDNLNETQLLILKYLYEKQITFKKFENSIESLESLFMGVIK